ncbi:phosphatidylinositol-specific phospholipase C1-like protein [Tunturibacter psychrotolerans]|uniref:Phosphatidylinositol-specific phospholipase C1-like protein n=1 Tax=Tunturiibacter psychrotolerans TaxID=3069686 RepID=A0AAU7ZUJ8_9BACT
MNVRYTLLCASVLALGAQTFAHSQTPSDNNIRMNQIQVIGSHNSYHAGIAPSESKLMSENNPKLYQGFEYRHRPLDQQLNSGIRQIELDIYADTKGGLYAHPSGPTNVAAAGLPADPDFDPQGRMSKPGFKVMHVQDFDYRSTCQPFIACLQIVRTWSKAHPQHVPVYILLETKQSDLPEKYHATPIEKFTSATFDALDAEIRSVFSPKEIITPDQVRGKHKTLEEAVLQNQWPTLKKARGKVVFLMDQRPVGPVYLEGHDGLHGRIIFTNAVPGQPDCAFTEENDGTQETIAALVRKGYIVRTRTDADTKEARTGDTTRRETALTSGAQLLSTDYPASEPSTWTSYSVSLPDNAIARCNPINAPTECSNSALNSANGN